MNWHDYKSLVDQNNKVIRAIEPLAFHHPCQSAGMRSYVETNGRYHWLHQHFPDQMPEGHLKAVVLEARENIQRARAELRQVPKMQAKLSEFAECHLRTARKRKHEWRPKIGENIRFIPTWRSTDTKEGPTRDGLLKLSPGVIARRADSGVPWVVTDRFVLLFENDSGGPIGPISEERDAYPCWFLDTNGEFKQGYLAYRSGFYGCAIRSFDAVKSARMRATKHVMDRIIGTGGEEG